MLPRALVAVGAALMTVVLTQSASAATRPATPLRAHELRGPVATPIAAGSSLTVRGTVRNTSRRTVRGGRVLVTVSRSRGTTYKGVRVGATTLRPLGGHRRRAFSARITLSKRASGMYRVLVCPASPGRRPACTAIGRAVRIAAPTPPATPPATPAPTAPFPGPVPMPTPVDLRTPPERLREAIGPDGLYARAVALQRIADANGGNRTSGTPGYDDSVSYVVRELTKAGYEPRIQTFLFPLFEELSSPSLRRTAPTDRTYVPGEELATVEYSGAGTAAGPVVPVDVQLTPPRASTSGCETADFAGFPSGAIALVQRGTCPYTDKVANAHRAGAAAVIVFNQGDTPDREGLPHAGLDETAPVPVVETTYAIGAELAALPGVEATVTTDVRTSTHTSANVIADTARGRADRTIVVGAHLDSVAEGPGINDNGSGTAYVLELATQLAALDITPANRVRFAFWGAEENGLLGSTEYVKRLTPAQTDEIALNLNFDMLASPNYARLVYDGDGSDTPDAGPAGSAEIERALVDALASRGLASGPTAFDGRSDYGPFIDVGIPAGGLFAGAEEIKTPAEAAKYGGTAGIALDPNYHLPGDTLANLNMTGFQELADAATDVATTYALRADLPARAVSRTTARTRGGKTDGSGASGREHRGPFTQR